MNNNISYRLDDKVLITVFAISIFFLGLMAFRYKNHEPCTTVDFSYRTANKFDLAYINEPVYFSSEIKYSAASWKWDFGDKTSMDEKSGPYTNHEYRQPGQYTVRLIINDKCEQVKTINVNKRADYGKKLFLVPLWPGDVLLAGREYNFGDNTTGAVTWSWYFDQEPKLLQKNLTYMFTEPGVHKVILVINDDIENNRIEKTFTVKPPPAVTTAPVRKPGNNPRDRNIPQDIPADKIPGASLDQIAASAGKIPTVSDEVVRGHLLNINGGGYDELKKYFKKSNFENCTIIFNNRPVTAEKLKELIITQKKYNKTFDVKQSINSDNNIIMISITATLESKKRFLLKDKQRDYNYE